MQRWLLMTPFETIGARGASGKAVTLRSPILGTWPGPQCAIRHSRSRSPERLAPLPRAAVAASLQPHRASGGRMGLLTGKYKYAMETAKEFHLDGTTEERDGKLYITGTVQTQDQANKIWDAIKTIPDWKAEIVADITATGGTAEETYTVKPGDTLGKIAKHFLGDAGAYPAIFDANRDQLSDPDKIRPGQVLRIPQAVKKS
jgi:LysM repeat protein